MNGPASRLKKFRHPVVLVLICYRTTGNRLKYESNTTECLRNIGRAVFAKVRRMIESYVPMGQNLSDPACCLRGSYRIKVHRFYKLMGCTILIKTPVMYPSRPNCFVRSCRIRVNLLSYESIPTDKQEQYDWRAEKNLDGKCHLISWMFLEVLTL